MSSAGKYKFAIGIDLGTTNCALSFIDLREPSGESQVLPIPQRESFNTIVERKTLPSFAYLPTDRDRKQFVGGGAGLVNGWVVGEMARRMTTAQPGRVAHSAKSWLGHHAVGVESPILPWDSDQVDKADKRSPLEISSAFLKYLRATWNERVARGDPELSFDRQRVTVTVPASFDAAAQAATLRAAELAGFPSDTRLLEEPQAAFYRCLENRDTLTQIESLEYGASILVVDVGGGTSDFSLFRLRRGEKSEGVRFERLAVSDHVLLGGDNIDLALAHALESELKSKEDDELTADQWQHLIARSRELKERCFGSAADESLSVALPSGGSSLLSGSLSTRVSSAEVRQLLLEGFFPRCSKNAKPEQASGGLQEWGLPYAPDFAVTRYLATFVSAQAGVDAALFNGGSLSAKVLQERLLGQIAEWVGGEPPVLIGNAEPDLSVARGAACYGALESRRQRPVEAGASRSVFVELERADGDLSRLLCVLPRGSRPGEWHRIELPGLRLRVNQRARFQVFESSRAEDVQPGEPIDLSQEERIALPPLEAEIDLENETDVPIEEIPVALECALNEIGTLEMRCISGSEEVDGAWSLAFNLRGGSSEARESASNQQVEAVNQAAFERARSRLAAYLDPSEERRRKLTAARAFKEVEDAVGFGREDWRPRFLRSLGDEVLGFEGALERSPGRAELFLYVVGYCLRPGYGHPDDGKRISRLWEILVEREVAKGRGVEAQRDLLWRRLSGGLDSERQEQLFDLAFPRLSNKKGRSAERIRMLGTIELISEDRKRRLLEMLLEQGAAEAEASGYATPYFAALSGLLARAPLYAGPDRVAPPEWVAEAFDRLAKLDWSIQSNLDAQYLFLRAARMVEERRLNVPARLSKRIIKKLAKAGVSDARLLPLAEYVPLTREDRAAAYGEALPTGLVLGSGKARTR